MQILRYDGFVLFDHEGTVRQCLEAAVQGGANLYRADLCGADLCGANLYGANLREVKGITPNHITPLRILYEQPGPIRAYKMTNENGQSPIHPPDKITYTLGESYEILDANTDENEQCATGINVATLDWCLHEYKPGWRIFVVEFTADDIACIPTNTDGKFRLHRMWVCAELDVDALLPKEV